LIVPSGVTWSILFICEFAIAVPTFVEVEAALVSLGSGGVGAFGLPIIHLPLDFAWENTHACQMLDNRFWSKVLHNPESGCLEWTANRNNKGYGMFSVSSFVGKRLAHRLSYEDAFGRIPPGRFVLHSCDNPKCVNPTHLRLGDAKENVADMDQRGRRKSPHLRGEANPIAKQTDETVSAIRRLYVAGVPLDDICAKFNITRETMHDYTGGRSWKHLLGQDGSPSLEQLKEENSRRRRNNAVLTDDIVAEIKRRLASGEQGKALAAEYGVHKATISDIKQRKTWQHVDAPYDNH
jgi:hypothetical protein